MSFVFLQDLFCLCEDWDLSRWRAFYFRSLARLEFGFNKYHKVMTPGDGRDSVQDAWEECFDLCIYLLKCYEEDRGSTYLEMYTTTKNLLKQLEKEVYDRGSARLPKD